MLAPVSQPPRVRCRQIVPADLGGLADYLTERFNNNTHDGWVTGFARVSALPAVEGMPSYGYVLECDAGIVGVLLMISSRRNDGRIIANLSSWYVEPGWRTHSTVLTTMATK